MGMENSLRWNLNNNIKQENNGRLGAQLYNKKEPTNTHCENTDKLIKKPSMQNVSYFLKGEASVSLEDETFSAYNGVGAKYSSQYGNIEGYIAGKGTDDTQGYFLEGKHTTPKILDTNMTGEGRIRTFTNWDKDGGKPSHSVNFRASLGYSENYGDWNLYARAGVSSNVSLHGKGVQTISPTVIGGVGYNISKDQSFYGELEFSRGYDYQKREWKPITQPSVNVGYRYNF